MPTFISYAREDLPLVRRLVDALRERNWEVWVDLEGIPFSAPWKAEIFSAITGADAFVAIISPNFLASKVCAEELQHAVSSSKRLVPVVIDRTISSEHVRKELAELNWLHLDGSVAFAEGVERLDEVLRTDLTRARLHAGLLVQARRWEDKDGERSLLLRGVELTEAEDWLADHAGTIPAPLPDHTRFIVASRRAASRRGRIINSTAVAVVVVLAILAVVALVQRNNAIEQQRLALARQLVAQAEATLDADPRTALQLNEAARQISPDDDTEASLIHDLTATRYSGTLDGRTGSVYATAFSPDGRSLVTAAANPDSSVILWDLADPTKRRHTVFPGRMDWGRALAFAPDGRVLATGHDDSTVILWDVSDPTRPTQISPSLNGHNSIVRTMAFSPDGHRLVTAGDGGSVLLWDVTDPTQPRLRDAPLATRAGQVRGLAFSPDGRTLVVAAEPGVDDVGAPLTLWDVSDLARPHPISTPITDRANPVYGLALSADGHTLATAAYGSDAPLILWDVSDPARPREISRPLGSATDTVFTLAFSPDGRTLAAADGVSRGSGDSSVILWNVADPTRPTPIGAPLTSHPQRVRALAFSRDGNTLVTARVGPGDIGHGGGIDSSVMLWDTSGGLQPRRVGAPLPGAADHMAFAPDGRTLAVAGDADSPATLWDVSDPSRPRRISPPLAGSDERVGAMAFSPDGRTLAAVVAGSRDAAVVLWNVADPTHPYRSPLPDDPSASPGALAIAPNGHTLAVGRGAPASVLLWDISDTAHPRRVAAPFAIDVPGIEAVAFSGDGTTLAVDAPGGTDEYQGSVTLWDVSAPAHAHRVGTPLTGDFAQIDQMAVSPDRHIIAASQSGEEIAASVVLWDVSDPTRPHRVGDPLTLATGPVNAGAFSSDGRLLATTATTYDDAGAHSSVKLWEMSDPARPYAIGSPLTGPDLMRPVAFSPDGHTLATAGSDHTVVLWNLDGIDALLRAPMARACAITVDGLAQPTWTRYVTGSPYQESCPDASATAAPPPAAAPVPAPSSAVPDLSGTPTAPDVSGVATADPSSVATARVPASSGAAGGADYVVTRTTGPYNGAAEAGQPGAPDDSEADVVQCNKGDDAVSGTATVDPRTSPTVLRIGKQGVTYDGDAGLSEFYAFVETTGQAGWNSVTLTVNCRKH